MEPTLQAGYMNLLLHAIVLLLKLNGRRSLDAVQAVRIVLHRQKNYVGSARCFGGMDCIRRDVNQDARLGLEWHACDIADKRAFQDKTAGAFGFLLLTQCRDRPELYGESRRFDTIPSRPSLQA